MNFFQHQDDARRASRRLVALFSLSLVLTIGILYAAWEVWVHLTGAFDNAAASVEGIDVGPIPWLEPTGLAGVSLFVLAIVGAGSIYKGLQLRDGGPGLALSMGAESVLGNEGDAQSRQLVNVVEEMAIASGVPTPSVFVLPHGSINAFAAGWSVDDAAVVLTRGALDHLRREELQAVVAHEFSHILHGDMRLNIVMMALLHGLVLVGMAGERMLLGSRLLPRGRQRAGLAHPGALAAAVTLLVAGSVGAFFGKLIKATLSRQREFLADASAVQFTRDPGALSRALQKITAMSGAPEFSGAGVHAASHLFLDDPVRKSTGSWFATHPPVVDRIRRLEPSWDGSLPVVKYRKVELPAHLRGPDVARAVPSDAMVAALAGVAPIRPGAPAATDDGARGGGPNRPGAVAGIASGARGGGPNRPGTVARKAKEAAGAWPSALAQRSESAPRARTLQAGADLNSADTWASVAPVGAPQSAPTITLWAQELCLRIGAVDPDVLHDSASLLARLPRDLYEATHVPLGAVGVVYALMIDARPDVRQRQVDTLHAATHRSILVEAWRLLPLVEPLPLAHRLPLLDLCAPALRTLSTEQATKLDHNIALLAQADARVDVFEFALHRILRKQLALSLHPHRRRSVQFHSMRALRGEAAQLLSWLAWAGQDHPLEAGRAYDAGVERLKAARGPLASLRSHEQCSLEWLEDALDRLSQAAPIIRAQVVDACVHAVLYDGVVRLAEAELLRAVAHVLEVPVPPLRLHAG